MPASRKSMRAGPESDERAGQSAPELTEGVSGTMHLEFELPGTGIRNLTVDAALVRDPAGTLERLLAQARAETDQNQMNQVLQFAEAFSQKNGVEFSIEPAAISGIVARARAAQQEVSVFCSDLFKDYPYGLKLLRDRDRNLQFRFPASALDDPDKFLSDRVVEYYRTERGEK